MSETKKVQWNSPEEKAAPPATAAPPRLSMLHCHPDRTAATFAIRHEDHTLGNALRHVLMQNSQVELAGYSVPHPSEPVVHLRVQTTPTTTAKPVLQQACQTVSQQCDHVLIQLEGLLPYVKEDRIRMEQYFQEEQNDEDEEDDVMQQ